MDAEHRPLLQSYLKAQEVTHARSLAEIESGHKKSCWIWWEWPAYAPVRKTSQPIYDLPSCQACASWLSHGALASRWVEITQAAVSHLEKGASPNHLFGSSIDVAKFHESVTLVSVCAPLCEQRELANRALRALATPPHSAVLAAVAAERQETRDGTVGKHADLAPNSQAPAPTLNAHGWGRHLRPPSPPLEGEAEAVAEAVAGHTAIRWAGNHGDGCSALAARQCR